jgi:ParB-like chromosome segregation protein Spo0J
MRVPRGPNPYLDSENIFGLSVVILVVSDHSEEKIKQIAASITEFEFTNPILIDSESGIIAGHGPS